MGSFWRLTLTLTVASKHDDISWWAVGISNVDSTNLDDLVSACSLLQSVVNRVTLFWFLLLIIYYAKFNAVRIIILPGFEIKQHKIRFLIFPDFKSKSFILSLSSENAHRPWTFPCVLWWISGPWADHDGRPHGARPRRVGVDFTPLIVGVGIIPDSSAFVFKDSLRLPHYTCSNDCTKYIVGVGGLRSQQSSGQFKKSWKSKRLKIRTQMQWECSWTVKDWIPPDGKSILQYFFYLKKISVLFNYSLHLRSFILRRLFSSPNSSKFQPLKLDDNFVQSSLHVLDYHPNISNSSNFITQAIASCSHAVSSLSESKKFCFFLLCSRRRLGGRVC